MPSLAEFEKWLTTGQAASKLGKTRQGATWLAENKRLRAVKTQAGWLIDPDSVEEFNARRPARDVQKEIARAEREAKEALDAQKFMRDTDPKRIEREIRESEESIKRARRR